MNTLGNHYEELAQAFLQQQGLTIITTNYTVHRVGEIDIIAYHEEKLPSGKICPTLVFVEVKMRSQCHGRRSFGQAIHAVTPAKQRKIIKTAEYFLACDGELLENLGLGSAQQQALACRFDVIAFDVMQNDQKVRQSDEKQIKTDWLKNAFLVE